MFRSFRLGTLSGFPVHINASFLLLLAVVALTMGGLAGVAVVLLVFASVLLHELGHSLVARHLGVRISGIELSFFGGAARMVDQPRRAGDEIAIAAAGPAVSFALAGLSLLLATATGLQFFQLLGWINLVLGAFNLIPALPMDGGRILRAALARRMGFARATELSVTVARVFAVALAVYGVVSLSFYPVLLAGLLWMMSGAERAAARMHRWQGSSPYVDDNQDVVEVLGRDQRPAAPGSQRRSPFAGGGFVVRRNGDGFVVERVD